MILEVPDVLVNVAIAATGVVVAAGGFSGAAVIAGRGISKFLIDMDTAFDAIASRRISGGR